MSKVLVATPLKPGAVTRPYESADGISIQEISPIRWDVSIVKSCVSEREREYLTNTKYWLCAEKESPCVTGDVGDDLRQSARHAAMALQIICPTGAKHIFLDFLRTSRGWDNIGSCHPKELRSTLVGRLTQLEHRRLDQFDLAYAGVRRAYEEGLVRLKNPIRLLEHGMQIAEAR